MARGVSIANRLLLATLFVGCATARDKQRAQGAAAGGSATIITDGGASNEEAGAGGAAGESAAGGESTDGGAAGETANRGSHTLFNGVDFTGWDGYLGKPSTNEAALGIDQDPRGVYTVVMLDGEPAIRISGEIWGSLISQQDFCNFRLRAQFKWGSKVWSIKDSGMMFLSTGPLGAVNAGGNSLSDPIGSGGFMVSTEYQIAPGDVGSLYNLGPIAFHESVHSVQSEKASDWNQVEISFQSEVASTSLNGHEVSRASGFAITWPGESSSALRCGKLQLQSEGAEIFFRRLEIEEFP